MSKAYLRKIGRLSIALPDSGQHRPRDMRAKVIAQPRSHAINGASYGIAIIHV